MTAFADWLARTPLSLALQSHEWVIPTVQSIHIVAIGVALVSAFMIAFRALGWTAPDQTLAETTARFWPWLLGALAVLLATGVVLILAEPPRELLAFSFWLKMGLVVAGTALTWWIGRRGTAPLALLTLLIWIGIIFLGRLIAYDHIWGGWSHSLKA